MERNIKSGKKEIAIFGILIILIVAVSGFAFEKINTPPENANEIKSEKPKINDSEVEMYIDGEGSVLKANITYNQEISIKNRI